MIARVGREARRKKKKDKASRGNDGIVSYLEYYIPGRGCLRNLEITQFRGLLLPVSRALIRKTN